MVRLLQKKSCAAKTRNCAGRFSCCGTRLTRRLLYLLRLWRPSRLTIWALCISVLVIFVIAFLAGYIPLHSRTALIAGEAHERAQALPRVEVITVGRSPHDSTLQLPGNIQATTEAPVLARADGYIKKRLVDIGDRVHTGQTLAIIEAPELDEQVRQAQANLQQAHAAFDQANANLQQGRADLELARVTAKRWGNLVGDGSVSVQENDQYQAQYQSKIAAVHALEQAWLFSAAVLLPPKQIWRASHR